MDKSTIAIAQIDPRLGNVAANLEAYAQRTAEARGAGADLVVFPELSLTGYLLKDMVPNVALRLDAPEIGRLKELSRGMALLAGFVEETPEFRFYNSAGYFEDGELIHVHRKVYLPTYGLFDEGRYFARGDRIRAFDCRLGRTAILVCEDMWHPSTVYIATLDRALTVLCPSASPIRGIRDDAAQDDNARYWESLNRIYAQTFSVSIVHANRVGFEDGVGFWGGSEILDAAGTSMAKAAYYDEELLVGDLSPHVARRQRVVAPMLRDEDVDLTINELCRVRGRLAAQPDEGGDG